MTLVALGQHLFRLLYQDFDEVHEAFLCHSFTNSLVETNLPTARIDGKEEKKKSKEKSLPNSKDKSWVTYLFNSEGPVELHQAVRPEPRGRRSGLPGTVHSSRHYTNKSRLQRAYFALLNDLSRSKSLQGQDVTVLECIDRVRAISIKLELWEAKVGEGKLNMLKTLSVQVVWREDGVAPGHFAPRTQHHSVGNKFEQYFPDLLNEHLKPARGPLRVDAASVQDGIQEEFVDSCQELKLPECIRRRVNSEKLMRTGGF